MDFWTKLAKVARLDRIKNERIREAIKFEIDILE